MIRVVVFLFMMATMPAFSQDSLKWLSPVEFVQPEIKVPVPDIRPNLPDDNCVNCDCCKCDTEGLLKRIESLEAKLADFERRIFKAPTDQPVLPAVRPKVRMYASRTCLPCQRWKNEEMNKFIAAGWDIEIEYLGIVDRAVPYFSVSIPGKSSYIFDGYLPLSLAK